MHYQPEQFYLRSAEEMKARFSRNARSRAQHAGSGGKVQPGNPIQQTALPGFPSAGETDAAKAYLRQLLAEGLARALQHPRPRRPARVLSVDGIDDPRKLPNAPQGPVAPGPEEAAAGIKAVMDRLEIELKVIEKTGFISYFLIVGDFVRYGRSKGVSCVARGSAAGSIVTYLLEISNVDPDPLRPAFRAIPQSRARQSAGYRH